MAEADLPAHQAEDNQVPFESVEEAQEDVPGFLEVVGDEQYEEPIYKTFINADGEEEVEIDDEGDPIVDRIVQRPLPSDYAVNFGLNHIYKILNFKLKSVN